MNNFETKVLKKLDEITSLLQSKKVIRKPLELEDYNFKINSDGWKKITVDNEEYLENKEGDVWELLSEECRGEQLFTYDAAIRETKKVGKLIPTDDELSELLTEKDDLKNIKYSGYRVTNASFYSLGSTLDLWSSSPSSATGAWRRTLATSYSTVYRNAHRKANGFSVRCLKN